MSNVQVGIRKWGTKPATNYNNNREDIPQIPFMRLKDGINKMRLVTDPATYYQVRAKLPLSKKAYGDRIRTAWPTYAEECPVKNVLGLEPKPRSMAIVIDRSDGQLKIFDMSVLVDEQVESILEVKNTGRAEDKKVTPRDFDIVVKFNSKAKKATGYYAVVADDTLPMEEEDLALIRDIGGMEVLEKILTVKTACFKPETVRKNLEKLGWDGKPLPKAEKAAKGDKASDSDSDSDTSEHEAPAEDDYSYDKTA